MVTLDLRKIRFTTLATTFATIFASFSTTLATISFLIGGLVLSDASAALLGGVPRLPTMATIAIDVVNVSIFASGKCCHEALVLHG